MKTLGNIIWLLLAGIWLFIGYVVAGILNCIFIITIPFGLQSFKLASFVIWPFGRTVADRPGASVLGSGCGNILWFVLGGWYMALAHFVTGVLLASRSSRSRSPSRTSSSRVSHLHPSGRRSSATPKRGVAAPTIRLVQRPAGRRRAELRRHPRCHHRPIKTSRSDQTIGKRLMM